MTETGRYIPDEVPGDFWRTIDACAGDRTKLSSILDTFDENDLLRFCWNYQEARGQISTLYHELTSFSEDTILDLCSWVVAQGESAFVTVWDDAETVIVTDESPYGRIQGDPGLLDVAMRVFRERCGKDVPRKTHTRFV